MKYVWVYKGEFYQMFLWLIKIDCDTQSNFYDEEDISNYGQ